MTVWRAIRPPSTEEATDDRPAALPVWFYDQVDFHDKDGRARNGRVVGVIASADRMQLKGYTLQTEDQQLHYLEGGIVQTAWFPEPGLAN